MDEATKRVLEMLERLGGATGQAVERLWPATVQAVWARGVAACAVSGFVALIGIAAALTGMGVLLRASKQGWDDTTTGAGLVFLLCGVLGTILSLVVFALCLPGVLAPEGNLILLLLKR